MDNEKKENIIIKFQGLINMLLSRYNILDMSYEDLKQEVLTHISEKLDDYEESKSALSSYIYMITKNKLNNLYHSKKNINRGDYEIKLNDCLLVFEELSPYTPNERIAIEVAYDVFNQYKHKDVIELILKGFKQSDISRAYGVSQSYINQIFKDYIEKVKSAL